ncbi:MFS transporter [Pseudomonas fontis]|uniref:MFS transporter n=1 Tax=Pseudomonas fontis TaxID=2942633 RepID=A0ABT5NSK2_9PSED|nr:MFS transporter [Pseudomonas fontis]MDD0976533.1 MFS transporter [Pseudomonas fontis]MDD0991154.1 MFS transporter [Pseudomonas fontis]
MKNSSCDSRAYRVGVILVILLVGLNLRPILAAIGPLLAEIQQATGLSSGGTGLLTTLPVVAMGICALSGAWLQRTLGETRGIGLGVLIIALACGLRWVFHDTWGLILTAGIGGAGIALVQALMPAYIKGHYPQRAGQLMGMFTTGIMGGAAIAAASAYPLAQGSGWSATLALAALPALLGVLVWTFCATRAATSSGKARASLPLRSGRAWLLLIFFGIGTGAYTLVLAWLPPFYVQLGWSAADSGYLLGALTLTEVVAGLMVSYYIGEFPDRRVPLVIALLLLLAGLACLIFVPLQLALWAALLLGLGIGALFPLSLIVTIDHAVDAPSAGALLGFVQGGGYLIASTMPYIAGVIRDHSSSLAQAWVCMGAGVLVLLVLALYLRPGLKIREAQQVAGEGVA